MMVHFRKRFSEEELSRINELIAERGKAMVMETVASRQDDDDTDDPDAGAGSRLSLDDFVKPADWPEGMNWGTLTIDDSCTPADITHPTVLKLINEARESTERIIDDLCLRIYVNTGHTMTERRLVPTSFELPSKRSLVAPN
jgi:transposase, IS5 family